jgi:hypothetical protein
LELARDIGEAANFATYFTGSPAAESTPHLYISALATWSQDTNLCRKWKKQFSRIPVFTHTKGKYCPAIDDSTSWEMKSMLLHFQVMAHGLCLAWLTILCGCGMHQQVQS